MNQHLVIIMIGEDGYYQIFNRLPDEFFGMREETQDALWGAVRAKIEDGEMDIRKLTAFARQWVELYPVVKSSVTKGIFNF